jgi:hypothetical protein
MKKTILNVEMEDCCEECGPVKTHNIYLKGGYACQ